MKRIFVYYVKYYDFEEKCIVKGGIQTYITNLLRVFKDLGYECSIFQCGNIAKEIKIDSHNIYQFNTKGENYRRLYMLSKDRIDKQNDIVIYADDDMIRKNSFQKSIGIQHGIAWDKPYHTNWPSWLSNLWVFKKVLLSYNKIVNAGRVSAEVCVDYNFINWYRSLVAYPTTKLIPIPNFTDIRPLECSTSDKVRIIFARRFHWYRGTRLFSNAARRIMSEYPNVELTIAGRGPDEKYIKSTLSEFEGRIHYTTFSSDESIAVHSRHDIAVVPTIGSEGTSLSLLEAMSAGCAVICTNVGGMTNIIIDKYNGLMITPDEDELYNAMKKTIEDENLRTFLATKARESVEVGFSLDSWREKWTSVINKVDNT